MLTSFAVLLLDSHLKALAVLLCGCLLSRLSRGSSAAHRHHIQAASFALALGAPILAATPIAGALVSFSVPKPPARIVTSAPPSAPLVPMSVVNNPSPGVPTMQVAAREDAPSHHEIGPAATPEIEISGHRPAIFADTGLLLPGLLWLGVGMLLVGRLAAFHAWLALRLSRARLLEHPVAHAITARVSREYSLSRIPVLKVGSPTSTPFLWGIRRPVVVLPPECATWDAATWEIILRHELAHVQRRDSLWRLVSQIVCIVNWFNPLVWRLAERLRRSSELACDEQVLASGVRASSYADMLVRFAADRTSRMPVLAMAGTSDLPGRIDAILRPTPTTHYHGENSMKRHALIIAAMLAALALVDVRLAADDKPVKDDSATTTANEIVMTGTPVRHLAEAWNAVAWSAHNNELWEHSALGFMNAARQDPTSTVDPYNAACAWSRQGKNDEAFEWLKLANQAGWTNADHARDDADLANIRKDPRFEPEMERWNAHELHTARHNAHKFLAKGLKAAEAHLFNGGEEAPQTPVERDAEESRLRTVEKAEWLSFIEEVNPLENRLPEDGDIKFRLGYALLMVGQAQEAMAKFEAAIAQGVEVEKSEYNIACCLATMGKTRDAVARLEELFGKNGERYWSYPVSTGEMQVDYDLRHIREDDGFKALLKTLESGGLKSKPIFREVWNNLQNVPEALATPIQDI